MEHLLLIGDFSVLEFFGVNLNWYYICTLITFIALSQKEHQGLPSAVKDERVDEVLSNQELL